ncbi:MAG TPA: fumarate reductase/succinate dehydrogenase flavoprotein subunit, partial [Methylomirabilota bacterium]|nr:fumarate reductase/succinate dehydrogenase flavoprotein subunit [Methylomirabilota bacterium]
LAAVAYVKGLPDRPAIDAGQVDAAVAAMLAPFEGTGREDPYAIHADLQECMHALVGIVRTEGELRKALEEIAVLQERLGRVRVDGGRDLDPGWHLSLDLHAMLTVSEATTRAAVERRESRGCHTRADYPFTDDAYGKLNLVVRRTDGRMSVTRQPLPEMPEELRRLVRDRT